MGQRYNVRPVIGTSIATGEQIRLVGGSEIVAAGFEISCVFYCASGQRKTHAGFTWRYESERVKKPRREGVVPNNRPKLVIGKHLQSGRTLKLMGKEQMYRAGFEPSCISRVACGKQANHKGWIFEYVQGDN